MKTMNKQEYKKWFDIIEGAGIKDVPKKEKPDWALPQILSHIISTPLKDYYKKLSALADKYKCKEDGDGI